MMITIADVLGAAELAAIREALAPPELFADGAATAGPGARAVKANLQARPEAGPTRAVTEKVRRALADHPVFAAAAQPAAFSRILVSRYKPGMSYGWHADEALIDQRRTDLAFTLFLSEPDSYDGGALEITSSAGTEAFRLSAGSAIVYSCGDLHQVAEVTRGERLAVVGWIQSRIRSSEQRELQFKLATALAAVQRQQPDVAVELAGIRQQLLRMWSEVDPNAN